MASAEYLVETAAITLLGAQVALSGVSIKHQQEDDSSVANTSRIIVKCDEKVTKFPSRNAQAFPNIWKANVTVTIRNMGSETSVDGWREAIDAALNGKTGSQVKFFPATGGGVSEGASDRREVVRTFEAMFAYTE